MWFKIQCAKKEDRPREVLHSSPQPSNDNHFHWCLCLFFFLIFLGFLKQIQASTNISPILLDKR